MENGQLFGAIQADIQVREADYDKWSEFSPLFCSIDVPFESIGTLMQNHWKETQVNSNGEPKSFPRKRLLVGGMKGEKLLLSSDLLRWHL